MYKVWEKQKYHIDIFKMTEATHNPSTASVSVKQKFKWKDKIVERLIELNKERPCLWNISNRSYSKRDVKEKALSEIKNIQAQPKAIENP